MIKYIKYIKYTLLAMASLIAIAYLVPKSILVYAVATGKINWMASLIVVLMESLVIGWIIDRAQTR